MYTFKTAFTCRSLAWPITTISANVANITLIACCILSQPAHATPSRPPQKHVVLNGVRLAVRWHDGDSFTFWPSKNTVLPKGSAKRMRARLFGINTLETYGPVHRWGQWNAAELQQVAQQATKLAQSQTWSCQRKKNAQGGYGRMLVVCPKLNHALLRAGLAHTFFLKGQASPQMLQHQQEAQNKRLGMWQKGIPKAIVASAHSAQARGRKGFYRLASIPNGQATAQYHTQTLKTCDEICLMGSCLRHVPYKARYGMQRASCLRRNPEKYSIK